MMFNLNGKGEGYEGFHNEGFHQTIDENPKKGKI